MPRGRHRQAPPLHRMLAPAALAATALSCAGGAWLAADGLLPRVLATGAAATALAGAALLRGWDRAAGRRLGEAQAARRSLEWRVEERCAELEEDLEEARALRRTAQEEARATEETFERLRTEHAALLRRYAHAETDRASALEGRRQLAIAAAEPAKALPPGRSASAVGPDAYRRACAALDLLASRSEAAPRPYPADGAADVGGTELGGSGDGFDYFGSGGPRPAPRREAARAS
ncbi:hypothetical protein [Streptomyces chumphonensis]|uniref:hypothetical protein n=1 Tax=Streptomyces chumphonensis TaxID=1214925 RepID=UPI003D704639